MYNKILVPLDGSKLAEAVLPYVRWLADRLHLPVALLHVHDPETVSPSLHPTRAADYLQQTATSYLNDLTVSCAVKTGSAPEAILDTTSADAGTLIAMATHGQTGSGRWLLGRVAQKVLQASNQPLMLIRPQQDNLRRDARLGTILVPLDGSSLAEQILPHVAYLAMHLGLQVVLIRTYMLPAASYFLAAHLAPPDLTVLREKCAKEIGDYLQAKANELKGKGVEQVTFVVAEGSGAEGVIDLARKTSGSMVAMSSHGRSGMGRWVLGSVTDRVVSHCGEPVLVIRPARSST
jgi:nucleotide-binding universal stress UspA family protein